MNMHGKSGICFEQNSQSSERGHRDALNNMRDEVEDMRRTRRSEADLHEEAYQDAISQEGEHILSWIARK